MMIAINRVGDSISGSYNGKPFGIGFSQEKWDAMQALVDKSLAVNTVEEMKPILEDFELLTQESYKELVETACPYLFVNKATNKFYLQVPGRKVTISSRALPKPFVDRILTSVEKKIDVMPLVKAFIRFLRNPNYTDAKANRFANYINKTHVNRELQAKLEAQGLSSAVAQERATSMQTAITQEGLLVTYKVSQELKEKWVLDEDGDAKQVPIYAPKIDEVTGLVTYDTPEFVEDRKFLPVAMGTRGDEFACDGVLGHIIRVGAVHTLPEWSQVDCNDDVSCVPGLHCGNIDYIKGYQGMGTETHNIFVDPMHIGAITDDGSGALRVKQYFVFSSFAGVNKGIYHSSHYAKLTDAEYDQMLSEAIKKHGELAVEQADHHTKTVEEAGALVF